MLNPIGANLLEASAATGHTPADRRQPKLADRHWQVNAPTDTAADRHIAIKTGLRPVFISVIAVPVFISIIAVMLRLTDIQLNADDRNRC
jgi:hypothetical protein